MYWDYFVLIETHLDTVCGHLLRAKVHSWIITQKGNWQIAAILQFTGKSPKRSGRGAEKLKHI